MREFLDRVREFLNRVKLYFADNTLAKIIDDALQHFFEAIDEKVLTPVRNMQIFWSFIANILTRHPVMDICIIIAGFAVGLVGLILHLFGVIRLTPNSEEFQRKIMEFLSVKSGEERSKIKSVKEGEALPIDPDECNNLFKRLGLKARIKKDTETSSYYLQRELTEEQKARKEKKKKAEAEKTWANRFKWLLFNNWFSKNIISEANKDISRMAYAYWIAWYVTILITAGIAGVIAALSVTATVSLTWPALICVIVIPAVIGLLPRLVQGISKLPSFFRWLFGKPTEVCKIEDEYTDPDKRDRMFKLLTQAKILTDQSKDLIFKIKQARDTIHPLHNAARKLNVIFDGHLSGINNSYDEPFPLPGPVGAKPPAYKPDINFFNNVTWKTIWAFISGTLTGAFVGMFSSAFVGAFLFKFGFDAIAWAIAVGPWSGVILLAGIGIFWGVFYAIHANDKAIGEKNSMFHFLNKWIKNENQEDVVENAKYRPENINAFRTSIDNRLSLWKTNRKNFELEIEKYNKLVKKYNFGKKPEQQLPTKNIKDFAEFEPEFDGIKRNHVVFEGHSKTTWEKFTGYFSVWLGRAGTGFFFVRAVDPAIKGIFILLLVLSWAHPFGFMTGPVFLACAALGFAVVCGTLKILEKYYEAKTKDAMRLEYLELEEQEKVAMELEKDAPTLGGYVKDLKKINTSLGQQISNKPALVQKQECVVSVLFNEIKTKWMNFWKPKTLLTGSNSDNNFLISANKPLPDNGNSSNFNDASVPSIPGA